MILDLSGLALVWVWAMFAGCAVVILVAGSRLALTADELADRTGLGEAITGAVFLGASTSLPGIITSVTTAGFGMSELAASNALGGIAAQTVFLAVGDFFFRRANLEHAAASLSNLTQGTLLLSLLALPLAAASAPEFTLFGVHPATPVMFGVWIYVMKVIRGMQDEPMWRPAKTSDTVAEEDQPEEDSGRSMRWLWIKFGLLAVTSGTAGYFLAESGVSISQRTGLGETAVGALMTGVATSFPELVTTITAIRNKALTLAVAGIIGGNAFDVLFLGMADVAYLDGSLYHAMGDRTQFVTALTIMMTGALLFGMLRREKQGPMGIGFESMAILALYIAGLPVILS
ncbi:Sodium/calcium antiporter [Caenispirillum salinarum AK4]|uniref:Sodium/calcium antiporter n=1 Tax=Caenispirillum salinarum AK4 TaxID=1238182 RepID=K9H2D2_9PROT|nr:sodium:calcium antiporter [Caenispirillum salinarum]EKV31722.1 Sodium/calcium antiporter [Caenispirillum salinarum AK4]